MVITAPAVDEVETMGTSDDIPISTRRITKIGATKPDGAKIGVSFTDKNLNKLE